MSRTDTVTRAKNFLGRLERSSKAVWEPLERLSRLMSRTDGDEDDGGCAEVDGVREEIEAVLLETPEDAFSGVDYEFKPEPYLSEKDRDNIRRLCIFFVELLKNLQQFALVFLSFLTQGEKAKITSHGQSVESRQLEELQIMAEFLLDHSEEHNEVTAGAWNDLKSGIEALGCIKQEDGELVRPDELFKEVDEIREQLRDLLKDGSLIFLRRVPIPQTCSEARDLRGTRDKAFLLLTQWQIYTMDRDFRRGISKKRKELNFNDAESGHGMDAVLRGGFEEILNMLAGNPTAPEMEGSNEEIMSLAIAVCGGDIFGESTEEPEVKSKKDTFLTFVTSMLSWRTEHQELKDSYGMLELCRQGRSDTLDEKALQKEAEIISRYFKELFVKKSDGRGKKC